MSDAYETPLFFHVMGYAASADRDVVDMVSGNPDWEPPEALRAALREYADRPTAEYQYPPSEGLRSLREEIAERRGVDADGVVITNGAGEANYLAMVRAIERVRAREGSGPFDGRISPRIVLTEPVYSYYPGKTRMLGADPVFVEAGIDGVLDPAAVRATIEGDGAPTAAIVVNTPNNPTGAVYSAETMRALVEIAESTDAMLISDEVYDHFDYDGGFASALAVDSSHRIVTNAFSKSMAITGLRVGYAIFPPALVEDAKSRHMLTNVAGSRPAQFAVWRALRETGPEYYAENRRTMADRIDRFTSALEEAGASYTHPDGSFYVLARFDGFPGTLENVERLVDEAGVAGMPGAAFGDSCADWLRFALVTPRVEEAAGRLAAYFG